MSDWIDRALEAEKFPEKIMRILTYFYKTHMSWFWLFAFGLLFYVAWSHLDLVWRTLFVNVFIALFIFTMASLAREKKEFQRMRSTFYNFSDSFHHVDDLWNKASDKSRKEFTELEGAIIRLGRWLLAFPREVNQSKSLKCPYNPGPPYHSG